MTHNYYDQRTQVEAGPTYNVDARTHNNPQFLSQHHDSILQYSIQNKISLVKAAKKIFEKKKPKRPLGHAVTPYAIEAFKKDSDMPEEIESDAETVYYGGSQGSTSSNSDDAIASTVWSSSEEF